MNTEYLNVISLIERLHRRFLELVKLELDALGVRDINNVQATTLFNIGDAEMTVGELTLRGCYRGGALLSECPPSRSRIGNHSGGVMRQSGCPSGFTFQNMILSK